VEAAWESPAFDVMFGGEWGDDPVQVLDPRGQGANNLSIIEDLDGDGLSELTCDGICLSGDCFRYFILPGASLRGADGAYPEDLAVMYLDALSQGEQYGHFSVARTLSTWGDWNGDGRPEVVIAAPTSETLGYRASELFVLAGDDSVELRLDDAIGSWVGEKGDDGMYILDTLGDGDPDLMFYREAHLHLVPAEIPALHTPLGGLQMEAAGGWIYRAGVGDIDQDGYPDFPFGLNDSEGMPQERFWTGWAIPWDDPEYW
jgi:hypothetical protein